MSYRMHVELELKCTWYRSSIWHASLPGKSWMYVLPHSMDVHAGSQKPYYSTNNKRVVHTFSSWLIAQNLIYHW